MTYVLRIAVMAGVVCLLTKDSFAEEGSTEKPSGLYGSVDTNGNYARITEERDRLVAEAIAVLRATQGDFPRDSFQSYDPRYMAIRVVEMFRAPEAVNPLCDMVDAWAPAPGAKAHVGTIIDNEGGLIKGRIEVAPHYPAAKALVEIGTPAAQECLNRLVSNRLPSKPWLYLWVIRETYGEKPGRSAIEECFKAVIDDYYSQGKLKHAHYVQERLMEVLAEYGRVESYIEKK